MRSSGKSWKLDCTAPAVLDADLLRERLGDAVERPTPSTWFSAPIGLMIWLPTSPATQTLSTFERTVRADGRLHHLGEVAAGG